MKDVRRTMNEIRIGEGDVDSGNNKLFNVLIAYANKDKEVGYTQGLNYIVALLLFFIKDEEQVFWCLCSLMMNRKYREIYLPRLAKVIGLSRNFVERLGEQSPDLLEHIQRSFNIELSGIFTGCFMTFALDHCPLEISTRLFEIFLLEGEETFISALLRIF